MQFIFKFIFSQLYSILLSGFCPFMVYFADIFYPERYTSRVNDFSSQPTSTKKLQQELEGKKIKQKKQNRTERKKNLIF